MIFRRPWSINSCLEAVRESRFQVFAVELADRAPAADPPARTTLRDDLPEQLARLTEAERTLLRLKALVGVATNKSDFLTMANASVIAALGGASLTSNTINPMLNRLLSLGLLNADFSCVESQRHPLAIEMIAAPEGPKAAEAVRRIFSGRLESLRLLFVFPTIGSGRARQVAIGDLRK